MKLEDIVSLELEPEDTPKGKFIHYRITIPKMGKITAEDLCNS